jgi:divalent metal cation (Fe/Co/Zn/Cd) transporter
MATFGHTAGLTFPKARWVSHKLHADVAIDVDETLPLSAANKIASDLEDELFEHMPALAAANIRFATGGHDHPHDHSHGHRE